MGHVGSRDPWPQPKRRLPAVVPLCGTKAGRGFALLAHSKNGAPFGLRWQTIGNAHPAKGHLRFMLLCHTFPAMMKLTRLAVLTAAVFAVASVQAGGKSCCAANGMGNGKMCTSQTYAKLNLTQAQKAKLDALHAKYDKEGCSKESMEKFLKSAKGVLSKEQYATLKAECAKMCKAGNA